MDTDEREEISLQNAENIIKHSNFMLACTDGKVTMALMAVIRAMKNDNYQLIRIELLLEKIEQLSKTGVKKGNAYIDCLEDVANILKECL